MLATLVISAARSAALAAAGLAALVFFAGQAAARPDPCSALAAIVSAYSNTSDNQGKTAAELFAELGELSVFARLGQAAAHVQDHEPEGYGVNVVSPNADAAYAALSGHIRWLDAADLDPFSGVALAPAYSGSSPFCTTGLLGGIYARENSAALIGRMADSLFIAFRATNDGPSVTAEPATPDSEDWTRQARHYRRYQYLLAAIDGYLAANPEIVHVYVAGDSLGAAMAQRYMLLHPGESRLRAILFGSPGNPEIAFNDSRIWTFVSDVDPILLVPSLAYKISGKRFLLHLGVAPEVPPRAIYHDPQAYARIMEHLDAHAIGRAYLAKKFAGGSASRWNAVFLRLRIVSEDPDDFAAGDPGTIVTLPGSAPRLMAGGDGADVIIGGIGAGDLMGFGGSDCLLALNRPERLTGGDGADHFVLNGSYDLFGGTILDFHTGEDDLAALNTLPPGTSIVDGSNFIRGTAARRRRASLIYDQVRGRLSFDPDGTGAIPSYLIGRFSGSPPLATSDIRLQLPGACS